MGNSTNSNVHRSVIVSGASISLKRAKNSNFPSKSQNSDFTFFREAFNKNKMSEKATKLAFKLIGKMNGRADSKKNQRGVQGNC